MVVRIAVFIIAAKILTLPTFASNLIAGANGLSPSVSVCGSVAGNLLQNCGFETGDFSDWTRSGNIDSTYVVNNFDGVSPNSGTQFAALGPAGSDGFLSQTIGTNPGDSYTITWYLASDGSIPNDFSATWDGKVVFSQTNDNVTDFVVYSVTQKATGTSTTLSFGFSSDQGYLALDDVSAVDTSASATVPEPAVLALLGLSAPVLIFRVRLRRAGLLRRGILHK